jgi:AcrR family transcriptional regulator
MMEKLAETVRHRRQRAGVRVGRPPQKHAGEVDERILDAAHHVFLERGLVGASVDEIANRANAGKPTIYARFPNKEALFAAVVMRNCAAAVAHVESTLHSGGPIEQHLIAFGEDILQWALAGDTVNLMRVSIAEAGRLSHLASNVHQMARGRGEEGVAKLLAEAAQADALGASPAFAPEHVAETARFFMELIFFPIIRRALFGEDIVALRAEIGPHVARSVKFFLAACRNGGGV